MHFKFETDCYHRSEGVLFSRLLPTILEIKVCSFTCSFIWVWKMISHTKART